MPVSIDAMYAIYLKTQKVPIPAEMQAKEDSPQQRLQTLVMDWSLRREICVKMLASFRNYAFPVIHTNKQHQANQRGLLFIYEYDQNDLAVNVFERNAYITES